MTAGPEETPTMARVRNRLAAILDALAAHEAGHGDLSARVDAERESRRLPADGGPSQ